MSEDPRALAQVRTGDHVHIHYTARLVDGTVCASSRETGPLEFTAGGPDVIEGISKAVIGMGVGESKLVAIAPAQGFGARDEELERRVALDELPQGVRVGDRFNARAGDSTIPVWVREIGEGQAVLDGNHPLAGLNLIFEIELVSFHP